MDNQDGIETPSSSSVGNQNEVVEQLRSEIGLLRRDLNTLKSKSGRALFKSSQREAQVDKNCSDAVRQVYKELKKLAQREENQENRTEFNFTLGYNSDENQAISKKIVKEVRALYGKTSWTRAVVRDCAHQYWRSLRDDSTRTKNNSYSEHRGQSKRTGRLKRKLEKRRSVLEKTPLSERDREGLSEILTSPIAIEYMSSEESDDGVQYSGCGPKPRKARQLTWERNKLRNLKDALDRAYQASLTPAQRRRVATVTRGDNSQRRAPRESPRWAVRDNH